MAFRKAQRSKARARIALIGVSGSGKTYSALLLARGLAGPKGRIAIIDTENGSADLYASLTGYDVAGINAPYEPKKYLDLIHEAEKEGYDVIIIDSLSHAWAGDGGLLDMQGKLADRGNSFAAWRNVTPWHNKLVDAMITSPAHIIATMRAKAAYEVVEDDRGKKAPKKIGLAPVQREGLEYEFTTVFDIDTNHNATVSKDRTSIFDGTIFKPAIETGEKIREWLESGVDAPKEKSRSKAKADPVPTPEIYPVPIDEEARPAPTAEEKTAVWKQYLAVLGNKNHAINAAKIITEGRGSNEWTHDDLVRLLEDAQKRQDKGILPDDEVA